MEFLFISGIYQLQAGGAVYSTSHGGFLLRPVTVFQPNLPVQTQNEQEIQNGLIFSLLIIF